MDNLEFYGEGKFPAIHSSVFMTNGGTPYLLKPGVVLIAAPQVQLAGLQTFLDGFDQVDPFLKFGDYLRDPDGLPPAEQLCKVAGQLCYMSFGPRRTMNADVTKYFQGTIIPSGHGSVLEHAQFSFVFYGLSRSATHELVRHRAGCAYSQSSQRYVSGKALRFVERPEYQADQKLHERFLARIDSLAKEYEEIAAYLYELQAAGLSILSGEMKTDLRKKVQQCARSALPNETEAPIVMSGNARAMRHIVSMRASEHAEVEIRELIFRAFLCLREVAPTLFADFEVVRFEDGTSGVRTKYPKV